MNMHLERMMVLPGLLMLVLGALVFCGCKPERRGAEKSAGLDEVAIRQSVELPLRRSLAEARLALAIREFEEGWADHALLHAVSSLEADAASTRARAQVAAILTAQSWAMHEARIDIGRKVDHLLFHEPNALWVASSDDWNTVSRWNADLLEVEAVLFPYKGSAVGGMLLDPGGQFMIVERRGRALLCDARSLKPIRDLGVCAENVSMASTMAFSSDGLLFAHLAKCPSDVKKMVWHLRDSKSGEAIRSEEVSAVQSPLSVQLDRKKCVVVYSDDSHWVMPVSPLEPCRWGHVKEPIDPRASPLLVDSFMPNSEGDGMCLKIPHVAPIRNEARISATHQSAERVIVACERGEIDFYHLVKLSAKANEKPDDDLVVNQAVTNSLKKLSRALTGLELDAKSGEMRGHDAEARIAALRDCDFDLLGTVLPEVNFGGFREVVDSMGFRRSSELSVAMLDSRLAEANPLAAGDGEEIAAMFASGDVVKIMASIESLEPSGAAAAKYLELALASSDASIIEACLRKFSRMPMHLKTLAHSRLAWLQQRKADAIAPWPEPFPEYESIRLSEDWQGWEQADFSVAFRELGECVTKELDSLKLRPDANAEQVQALAARFEDPETMRAIGKSRYAKACIDAAFIFGRYKDHAQTALTLAMRARHLGHAPEPCLRAEAMAHTALRDYHKAHDRWVMLITEFPVGTHESGDYAEAAYTAFENADERQAIEILLTGMHRFPQDADYALRAGWIALLTDHHKRAYQFLIDGKRIGYRPEKIEYAMTLLALAAAGCDAKEEAAAYYVNLVASHPAWKDAKAIEALDWPVEMKSALESVRASAAGLFPTR